MRFVKVILIALLITNATSLYSQDDFDKKYEICLKAIDAIKTKDYKAFTSIVDRNILRVTSKSEIIEYLRNAHKIANKYNSIADQDYVLIEEGNLKIQSRKLNFTSLNFPYPPQNDRLIIPDQFLTFTFSRQISRKKIIGFGKIPSSAQNVA